ncbi:MAG TPA: sodium:proton antiporter, partial [Bacteroidia bacterium]|nr:sodium:proton antiporter [Bacteroidia bacterium]
MIANILLILCGVVLIAYLIDVFSAKIKVPSVVLLLTFGFAIKYSLQLLNIAIPDVSRILPLVGTVGLVLIVLEGALELKIDATKIPLIKKAFWVSWLAILILAVITVSWCYYVFNYSINDSIVNLMPLCIIS